MRSPPDFHGFIGQRKTVRFLQQQIQGAKAHGEPCPHLLFVAPSGMGKTCLANAVTKEYGGKCRIVHGKATARNICEQLVMLEKGDFLFLDEAHNLPRESQELLYQIIDAGLKGATLKDYLAGEWGGQRDEEGQLLIQPVTVILATDQPGKLLDALRKNRNASPMWSRRWRRRARSIQPFEKCVAGKKERATPTGQRRNAQGKRKASRSTFWWNWMPSRRG